MSNALTTSTGVTPEPFANPLQQIGGLMGQPAVRRALPMILLVALLAAAVLAWTTFSTPTQKVLFTQLTDADKAAVSQALSQAGIDANIDDAGSVTVADDEFHKARMLLAQQDLPRATPGGYQILDQLPMGVSRAVEGERLRQARETELARSIQEIDAVAEARVHLAMPEKTVFVRDNDAPSASVIVKLNAGRSLGEAQVRSIVNLVASSVPGMKPDNVTIVDQAGGLLSKPDGGASAVSDARIQYQSRMEDKVRAQLTQLLTPLVGAGNFSTEVQAEVDLNETSATRESYDKNGQMLRAEQGQWTGNQKEIVAPGGIPGTLSNTAPPAGVAVPPGAAPSPAPSASPTTDMKQSDQFARAYDLGKEVSVSRTAPGDLKRLSVAVLLRDPDKGRRTALEVGQITDLVKAAVGFNAGRQDQVTIISRKFAGAAGGGSGAGADIGPAWYDNAWLPIIARNVTAIVIALLVLILGVKPLSAALMKRRDEAPLPALGRAAFGAPTPGQGQLGQSGSAQLDRLESTNNYDDRVGIVRGFTRENPARAALAVRDMIKADAR